MRRLFLIISAALALGATGEKVPTMPELETIRNAERVAKSFLASIDAGNAFGAEKLVYEREHKARASGRVTRMPVVAAHLEIQLRKRFGPLKSRKLIGTEILKEHADFPPGLFVRFRYSVKYDLKEAERIETLTIKADNPQRWTVVGF